jgi:MerR family transcriptional regulator, mercuric resistance operon regulatory protein
MAASLTISRLAREAGVGVETVRYYQRRGLMPEPERPGGAGLGGVRRYGADDVRRLRFIRAAQASGFSLGEIGELLEMDAANDRARARAMAESRIAALDARIEELRAARAALSRLATECAAGGGGSCPILAAFEPSLDR